MSWMKIWDLCQPELREMLTKLEFVQYIQPLQATEHQGGASLLAPNRYIEQDVNQKYLPLIIKTAQKLSFNQPITTRVIPAVQMQSGGSKTRMAFGQLDEKHTFDRFVVGKCNSRGHEAAKRIVDRLLNKESDHTPLPNPLIFYGAAGFGKSHLLGAIGHQLTENNTTGIGFERSCNFRKQFVSSLYRKQRTTDGFSTKYSSLRVLLLDDVHLLAKSPQSQGEVMFILNSLFQSGAQVVMTCDTHPGQMKDFEAQLADRLSGGLAVMIKPHTLQVRSKILIRLAREYGRSLSGDVAARMSKEGDGATSPSGRTLIGWINQLCLPSRAQGEAITLNEFSDLLSLRQRPLTVTVDQIQDQTEAYFSVSHDDLLGKRRSKSLVYARHIGMYLCKKITSCSYPEIGRRFGGRNHTTVLHACHKVETLAREDEKINNDINQLTHKITG